MLVAGTKGVFIFCLIVSFYWRLKPEPSPKYARHFLGQPAEAEPHNKNSLDAVVLTQLKRKNETFLIRGKKPHLTLAVLTIILTLSGDIELNPGPSTSASVYPCGLCQYPVSWTCKGICCDNCDIWFHHNCADVPSAVYETLGNTNAIWSCPRCDSTNFDSFTFRSYEINCTNSFSLLETHGEHSWNSESLLSPSRPLPPRTPLQTSTPILPIPNQNRPPQKTKPPLLPPRSPLTRADHPTHPPKLNPTRTTTAATSPTQFLRNPSIPPTLPQLKTGKTTPPLPKSPLPTQTGQNPPTSESQNSSDLADEPALYEAKKRNKLRILSFNCQSIVKKRASLELVLDKYKPEVICGTESWLRGIKPGEKPKKDAIMSSEIFPPEYIIHRNDRDSPHPGGGVFIGIHQSIAPWTVLNIDPITNCEIIWCKTHINGTKPLHFGCFYMAHRNRHDLDMLNDSLKRLKCDNGKNVFLFGDFNCPDINWDENKVEPLSDSPQQLNIQEHLTDIVAENLLTQTHRESTRGDNLLDLVFTTNESLVQSTTSVPGISDHDMVVIDSNIKPPVVHKPPRKCYRFSRANWENINADIRRLQERITSLTNGGSPIEELWSHFRDSLKEIIDSHIPFKMIKSRPNLPWINPKIQKMTKKKAKLYKKAKQSKDWTEFKDYQNECRKEIRKAEWTYINNTIKEGFEENNSKPFWRYIKSRRTDNTGVAALKKNDSLLTNPVDKANALIDQFKSVFTTSDDTDNLPNAKHKTKKQMPHIIIHQQGVKKLLEHIKTTKAMGPDGIPNQILKECADSIAPILTTLFQSSLNTGTLPRDWLDANVAPIFKKGDKQLCENYRPVSLTSVSSKILEHIICKELLNHLESNKILTSLNHGFRSGYSCETQLIVTMQDLMSAYEAGLQTDVAILDFSKAFDTVPHKKLLYKLETYGVNGPLLKWFSSFLTTRSMKVVVDGKESKSVHVASGVPQGTVLGPILFLCHINDLPESVKSQVRLFADDCLLYRIMKTLRDHVTLQNDLKSLEAWSKKWGMRFNPGKCYVMSIKEKSPHFYELCGQILKNVNQNPYLGVLLSNDLKWAPHIDEITSKASSTLGFLRRNLRNCPEHCKKLAYLSLIRPSLEYAATVWDPYFQKDIDRLEQIQRRAVRFIVGDYKNCEEGFITNKMKELDLPPLQDRRRNMRLSMFYKIVNDHVPAIKSSNYLTKDHGSRQRNKPKYLDDYVTAPSSSNSTRNNSQCFKRMNASSAPYENSFFPQTIINWNNLPDDVTSKPSVESFKTALTKINKA